MEPSFSPGSTHAPSLGPSDSGERATSPSSSPLLSSSSNPIARSPLYEMSSIMKQLPIKRGLSQHFQGKSQSFTSLSNVKCLEDLAKPERSPNKKLKPCKSHESCSHKASSTMMSKKDPRKSFFFRGFKKQQQVLRMQASNSLRRN
ncbi:hypothetical protein ACLOJK_017256 [Asimina triloba]